MQVTDYPPKKWLYNLANDPTEQKELSESYPNKTAELLALINSHAKGARQSLYKPLLLANIEVDRNLKEITAEGPVDEEEAVWVTN